MNAHHHGLIRFDETVYAIVDACRREPPHVCEAVIRDIICQLVQGILHKERIVRKAEADKSLQDRQKHERQILALLSSESSQKAKAPEATKKTTCLAERRIVIEESQVANATKSIENRFVIDVKEAATTTSKPQTTFRTAEDRIASGAPQTLQAGSKLWETDPKESESRVKLESEYMQKSLQHCDLIAAQQALKDAEVAFTGKEAQWKRRSADLEAQLHESYKRNKVLEEQLAQAGREKAEANVVHQALQQRLKQLEHCIGSKHADAAPHAVTLKRLAETPTPLRTRSLPPPKPVQRASPTLGLHVLDEVATACATPVLSPSVSHVSRATEPAGSKDNRFSSEEKEELTWYEWKTKISNIEDVVKVDWIDRVPQDHKRIALIGKSKSGKTWLRHQLASLQLKAIDHQGTPTEVLCSLGLCCKPVKLDQNMTQVIDNEDEQKPICHVSEISVTDQNSTEDLLRNTLCRISDALIYMVNQGSPFEQWVLMNLVDKQNAQNSKFTIIIVHNLSHLFRLEEFVKAKSDICDQYIAQGLFLKRCHDVDFLIGPSSPSCSNTTHLHVFLAQQCDELNRGNEQTIGFLRKCLASLSFSYEQAAHCDHRNKPQWSLEKAMSRGRCDVEDDDGGKSVKAASVPTLAAYRIVETQTGTVRVEIDSPGYSKEQMDIDLAPCLGRGLASTQAQYGTHKFLHVSKLKSRTGVEITVKPSCIHPLMPGGTEIEAIAIEKQISISEAIADYQDGTVFLTFPPAQR